MNRPMQLRGIAAEPQRIDADRPVNRRGPTELWLVREELN